MTADTAFRAWKSCCMICILALGMSSAAGISRAEFGTPQKTWGAQFPGANPTATPAQALSAAAGLAPANPGLQWQILQNPNGRPRVVVIDPEQRVMAVYEIDPADGVITLKSVRKIAWDLKLEAFNTSDPAPSTIEKRMLK